jgi:hypothetical protein
MFCNLFIGGSLGKVAAMRLSDFILNEVAGRRLPDVAKEEERQYKLAKPTVLIKMDIEGKLLSETIKQS